MPRPPRSDKRPPGHGLSVLYEDDDLIVVDKPAGLLTVGTDRQRERTAYAALTQYVKKGNPRSRERVFVVHRLDRETSGALIFARSETAKIRLQACWGEIDKRYLAVVQGCPEKIEGTITSYLAENRAQRMYSTGDPRAGKLSHTAYRVAKTAAGRTLVEVFLLTGRKNQIRVHLADIGHPVIGDEKYGPEKQPRSRLALHAWSIVLPHPTRRTELRLVAPVPHFFTSLVGSLPRDLGSQPCPSSPTDTDFDDT